MKSLIQSTRSEMLFIDNTSRNKEPEIYNGRKEERNTFFRGLSRSSVIVPAGLGGSAGCNAISVTAFLALVVDAVGRGVPAGAGHRLGRRRSIHRRTGQFPPAPRLARALRLLGRRRVLSLYSNLKFTNYRHGR